MKIYLASALSNSEEINVLAEQLKLHKFEIVSNWHQEKSIEPSDNLSRKEILETNLSDLRKADVVVANTCEGKPCATFGEIGYAIAFGIRVIWVMPGDQTSDFIRRQNIFDASHLCTILIYNKNIPKTTYLMLINELYKTEILISHKEIVEVT